jgi:hypothetical protein
LNVDAAKRSRPRRRPQRGRRDLQGQCGNH